MLNEFKEMFTLRNEEIFCKPGESLSNEKRMPSMLLVLLRDAL